MRAVVYSAYGGVEQLRLVEVEKPRPGMGEALIRVKAASLNSWDWDLLRGQPFLARLGGLLKPYHPILGADVAGVVEAVGAGVGRLAVGDKVFGDLSGANWGGFAEFVCAPEAALAMIPEGVSFEAAAATPQAGLLAWQGLRWKGEVRRGDKVLINGAGGGAGTFAIQLAKRAGAKVTGVDSAEKAELMQRLGADQVVDYRAADFAAGSARYDLILDMVAARPLAQYRRVLTRAGRLAVVGGTTPTILAVASIGAMTSKPDGQQLGLVLHRPDIGQLAELGALIAAGEVKPAIDRVYPLAETAAAFARIGAGQALGKLVLVP
ncbi:MAG TPA: NAD(P)-dependent alcohol dehydrogenase [Devosia sp.]|jgi:NADPH:quinone reductase-like Zn-dependent oxidoreductase|uniref:NAD(P)-dependent alcohol dehydrogenase n=1 Tax=Devosia sp. TaxID=1871048 RepID=UPI002DDD3C93|nr:NAD(P)-dependent alcohol dehydrogenase [Devosia sp.]HEV2517766.1 NAD(P)-dependent alcohol dehydrogenase [Devosia sp.]